MSLQQDHCFEKQDESPCMWMIKVLSLSLLRKTPTKKWIRVHVPLFYSWSFEVNRMVKSMHARCPNTCLDELIKIWCHLCICGATCLRPQQVNNSVVQENPYFFLNVLLPLNLLSRIINYSRRRPIQANIKNKNYCVYISIWIYLYLYIYREKIYVT